MTTGRTSSHDFYDVLILGSGAAGLTAALDLSEAGLRVALVSKAGLGNGSTAWAQGGIAAVLAEGDTIDDHVQDTMIAGAGLCREDAVRHVVENSREAIQRLIDHGVPFSKGNTAEDGFMYHLTREGGHGKRRIIHVDDATGKAVQKTLEDKARAAHNITIYEDHVGIDLLTDKHLKRGEIVSERVYGAYLLNRRSEKVITIRARSTILATGGASKVYLYTSNPDGSTGDGIAMAWRAGCRVANMEFNQFHPTCLYHPSAKSFLISEALRGEGAVLTLPDGSRFMPDYDERAELAPRDVVARAIDDVMKRLGLDYVLLNISHKDPDFIIGHFPNIYRRCLEYGFDITKEAIPVVPAAHYTCGGVMIDQHGRTDIEGLYAIGEVSHSGLHGANRMASNSLLECLVYGASAAKDIIARHNHLPEPPMIRPWDSSRVANSDELVVINHNWDELRRLMWSYVGIVRTDKRLERAKRRIDMLTHEIEDYYGSFEITRDMLELRNLVAVADLIVQSAQLRKESRGLHYTTDHLNKRANPTESVLDPNHYNS